MPLNETMLRNQEHKAHRAGWLRAAVLGVNDGLVSTASLMVGPSYESQCANAGVDENNKVEKIKTIVNTDL